MDYAAAYTQMHEANQKAFAGFSIKNYVDDIAKLVYATGAQSLLDYGSGKGYQYLAKRVHEQWGGILPTCYDVGVRQLSDRPVGTFDGVICTDVMEHIDEPDVDRILADIFSFAEKFVFLCISCRPAKKKMLPDGRNVHLTVRSPEWWNRKISALKHGDLVVQVAYDE